MVTSFSRATVALWLSVVVAAGFAACGGNSDVASPGDKFPNKDASVEGSAGDSGIINEGGGIDVGVNDAPQTFDVQPSALQTITVPMGTNAPTVSYDATLGGKPTAYVCRFGQCKAPTTDPKVFARQLSQGWQR